MKSHTCQRCQQNKPEEQLITSPFEDVELDLRGFLGTTRYQRLCTACLDHLGQLVQASKGKTLPSNAGLQEGTHYYIEKGNFVFTEKYHLLKGYCCQNGCRHCIYGFSVRTE